MTQSRWRSNVLWAAVVAQILSLVQLSGLAESLGLDMGMIGDVAAGVLQLLVIVGVLNNPTDPVNW